MSNGKRELGKRPVGGRAYSEMGQGLSAIDRAGMVDAMAGAAAGVGITALLKKGIKNWREEDLRRFMDHPNLTPNQQKQAHARLIELLQTREDSVGPVRDLGVHPGGRTVSDRVFDYLPGGRTTSDRLRKKGGSVKKYAKGGGVRKARYK
jgi:hypothetical protein